MLCNKRSQTGHREIFRESLNIAVIGASGKMGKGIALILLQMMETQEAESFGTVGKRGERLFLVDLDDELLYELKDYFRPHLTRYAEKSINDLRSYFTHREDLVANSEMIEEFVEGALEILRPTISLDLLKDASLVFEAIVEDLDTKVKVLKKLGEICPQDCYFLINTSSIPINLLAQKSGLQGRVVGAHFYNPPPVQKLLELIFPQETPSGLKEIAIGIGKQLKKIVVISKDVPGFIGNGHFLREIDQACRLYDELRKSYSHTDAILIVESITRDFLVRPMGMFQLLDYVGLDVGQKIASVMDLPFHPLLQKMVEKGKVGGQNLDGSQKEGFFRYEKGKIVSTYDLDSDSYVEETATDLAGSLPDQHLPWKEMKSRPDKLETYAIALAECDSLGAQYGQRFLDESRKIAQNLVDEGVAQSLDDVQTVLRNGFYHILV